MSHRFRLATGLFALLVAALTAAPAHAGIVVTLDSIQPDINFPGYYRWRYSATASPGDVIEPDGFFTVYDFPDILTISSSMADWQVDTGAGLTPAGLTPTDDPALPNVTHRDSMSGFDPPALSGTFDVITSQDFALPRPYTWQVRNAAGDLFTGQGIVNGLGGPPSSVPEPASATILAVAIASALRRRGQRPAVR